MYVLIYVLIYVFIINFSIFRWEWAKFGLKHMLDINLVTYFVNYVVNPKLLTMYLNYLQKCVCFIPVIVTQAWGSQIF